jgi:hypothetical protein
MGSPLLVAEQRQNVPIIPQGRSGAGSCGIAAASHSGVARSALQDETQRSDAERALAHRTTKSLTTLNGAE